MATAMHSNNHTQAFPPKPRARKSCLSPLHLTAPRIEELVPCFNESGLLTPASEEFNQFLFEARQSQTGSGASHLGSDGAVVVAVIGVGYVGFQLVQAFSKHYPVVAFDVSKHRLEAVRHDFDARAVYLTFDPAEIAQATHILIAVPTRVHEEDKSIDTSHLRSAIDTLTKHARPGAVVVVESSVAVGMTRDLLGPLAYSRGFKAGMSPERVDPGRTNVSFEAIPKIVSGLNSESLEAIRQLYDPVFDHVVPVSSCEVAEMTKLYENCQRMIGIAYANEMADACQTLGIDPIEVCSAAGTKPFGYQSYLPSAGVGGHCIPVNPYYLLSNLQFPLLQAATEKMWQRPAALVDNVMDSLAERRKYRSMPALSALSHQSIVSAAPTRILVVGVAFKSGQSVTSHSPGIAMIDHLIDNYDNTHVEFCDPLVSAESIPRAIKMNDVSDWNTDTLDNNYDAIVVAMAQHGVNLDILTRLQKARVFNFSSSLKGFGLQNSQQVFGLKRDSGVGF